MRFPLPLLPAEFEIPDEWWREAGIGDFTLPGAAFRSSPRALAVPLRQVEPPFRLPEHPKDWRGFDRGRLISILQGIAAAAEIEAVPVAKIEPTDVPESQFVYRVRNGLHRFYASVAAGFTHLPVVIQ